MQLCAELNRGPDIQPVFVVASSQQSGLGVGENRDRKGVER